MRSHDCCRSEVISEFIMSDRIHIFLSVGVALILIAACFYHVREYQLTKRAPAEQQFTRSAS